LVETFPIILQINEPGGKNGELSAGGLKNFAIPITESGAAHAATSDVDLPASSTAQIGKPFVKDGAPWRIRAHATSTSGLGELSTKEIRHCVSSIA
jgi:hypothetical protein